MKAAVITTLITGKSCAVMFIAVTGKWLLAAMKMAANLN